MEWESSVLALGLKNILTGSDKTNKAELTGIIRYAVDNGVNYIDAGYQPIRTDQEKVLKLLGKALKEGYRQKVRIAVTVPSVLVEAASDFDKLLEYQLNCLDSGEVDFCILEGLNRFTWPYMRDAGILKRAEKSMNSGIFSYFGFFFHDYFQALRSVVEEYDNWTSCGFQYSYMDVDHHPGYGGLKYAFDKGLAVYTTEPHLGGRLTIEPPESVYEAWKSGNREEERLEWALRWVWHHEEISTVVSNMSNLKQIKENVRIADSAEAEALNVSDKVFISRVRDTYRKLRPVDCTACRACMPCTQGIDAPRIFEIYNDAVMYDDWETARRIYAEEGHRTEDCTNCGSCAKTCGRQIAIPEQLEEIGEKLAR